MNVNILHMLPRSTGKSRYTAELLFLDADAFDVGLIFRIVFSNVLEVALEENGLKVWMKIVYLHIIS